MPKIRTCRDCGCDISDLYHTSLYCLECANKREKEIKQAYLNKKKQLRAKRQCSRCIADITHMRTNALYCPKCAIELRNEKSKAWQAANYVNKSNRLCLKCGVDISTRPNNAKYCMPCIKVTKAISNKVQHEKKIREPKQKVDHRPKPTSVIRAVTPLKSELGHLTRVDKVREITPSPVLSKHQNILHPNKNTYIFKNYKL